MNTLPPNGDIPKSTLVAHYVALFLGLVGCCGLIGLQANRVACPPSDWVIVGGPTLLLIVIAIIPPKVLYLQKADS